MRGVCGYRNQSGTQPGLIGKTTAFFRVGTVLTSEPNALHVCRRVNLCTYCPVAKIYVALSRSDTVKTNSLCVLSNIIRLCVPIQTERVTHAQRLRVRRTHVNYPTMISCWNHNISASILDRGALVCTAFAVHTCVLPQSAPSYYSVWPQRYPLAERFPPYVDGISNSYT